MTKSEIDAIILQALSQDDYINDWQLRGRLQEEFPKAARRMYVRAWDWPPVERSLMRLRSRGLARAREDSRGRLVDWEAVNPLDELAKIL